MISELRSKVQAHIGRLPVSFYDANKTGALVSRIMSDIDPDCLCRSAAVKIELLQP
jgi:ABC-type multidrug transport system fused ATPase/permease subunit